VDGVGKDLKTENNKGSKRDITKVLFVSKDQAIGALMLVGAVVVIILFGWMMLDDALWKWAISIIATVAVVGVMGIVAWIGYTMATTPPPEPIEFEEPTETPAEEDAE
jgi:NADH:ubiquinone oxidoreductase subunit 6 (subunit J)